MPETLPQIGIKIRGPTNFEALHRNALAEQQDHAGIIIANRRVSDADLARRVMKLLDLLSADEMKNQLLYI